MAMTRQDKNEIESIMDKSAVGVRGMLLGLADIAQEKSAHVAENWQDPRLARRWLALARKLDRLAQTMDDPYKMK